MTFTETFLKGAYVIDIDKINDDRGFFGRVWCHDQMANHGLKTKIIQSNCSFSSKKGTLRGLHFQIPPYQETKFMRCTKGAIYEVIIDLRKDSPTFKQWFGVKLTENNYKMLYVPENFANGFLTLEDESEANYMTTQVYNSDSERGIRWNDPTFNIEWPIDIQLVSEKDKSHPNFDLSLLKL